MSGQSVRTPRTDCPSGRRRTHISLYVSVSGCPPAVEETTYRQLVRIASDVLSGGELTPSQRTALDALVNTFGSDGATGAEWETALPGMAKRTYYRCRTVLVERGYVDAKGSRFVARRRSA